MKPTDLIKAVFPGAVVCDWRLAKDGPMSEAEIREAEDGGFAMIDGNDGKKWPLMENRWKENGKG
ncbi:hypothetical protein KKG46_05965 [Patescibacteria group bacterium]|nr:hypothetical protein [Patescibacteria group bacterium]